MNVKIYDENKISNFHVCYHFASLPPTLFAAIPRSSKYQKLLKST